MMARCRLCPAGSTIRPGEGVSVVWAPSADTHLVVWTTPDGRRRRKRSKDHRHALAVADDVVEQLRAAPLVRRPSPERPSVSVSDLCRSFVAAAAPERGWSLAYVKRLEEFIDLHVARHLAVPASTWDKADTQLLLDAVRDRLAATSRKQLLSLLRQTVSYARDRGVVDGDPVGGVRVTVPKRHRPTAVVVDDAGVRYVEVDERPTTKAVERLAAALDADGYDGDTARLAAYAGLRWGELWALERTDLDVDAAAVMVERRVDTKNLGRGRVVMTPDGRRRRMWPTPYGPAALPKGDKVRTTLLPPWLGHLADRDGLLFPTRRGGYRRGPGTSWNSGPFARAREAAGWPRAPDGSFIWTWHSLRHHAASWMLEQGIPVADVSEMLGHTSVQTTLTMYVHTTHGASGRAARRLAGWVPPTI